MATIRQKSRGQWQALVRRMGWPHQSATFKTRKEAEMWARQTEAHMDRGVFVDQTAARQTTFRELIDLYIEQVTAYRPSEYSRVSETCRLRAFQRDEKDLCAHAVINLTPDHFEEYRDRCLREGSRSVGRPQKPGTVKRNLTTLKRVIDFRKRQLGLIINPVNSEDVKRPAVNDERDVRLSLEERERLLEACYAARNDLLGPIVEFAFETGARRGNILRLEWTDVNLGRKKALLRAIKNSRSPDRIIDHEIGLTPRAADILEGLPRTDDRVFPLTPNALRLAFNRARRNADVEHFRFHDTRHERVSSLFEANWSMMQVMAQSGHRDPKSVKRYTKISGDYLADALARL
ncbi:MAG: site-specific integrase [Alphaproteobacteria bacterium]|nr:site-specific integrase [Alphaproteobacteria bacterium]